MKATAKSINGLNSNRAFLGSISETIIDFAQNKANYPVSQLLHSLLDAARSRLSMDVAFISEFTDGNRMFRYVCSKPGLEIVKVGEGDPLEESYCQRVVDGRLPELMTDATQNPEACKLPATQIIPVGAHISVPIHMSDGSVYGTFCAFSRSVNETLDERDLAFLRVLADISTVYLEQNIDIESTDKKNRTALDEIIRNRHLTTHFQPIVRLRDGRAAGFEALTRTRNNIMAPDKLFEQAARFGMSNELSKLTIETAFRLSAVLTKKAYISINAGPEEILNGLVEILFREQENPSRYVLEITEHDIVKDYEAMVVTLNRLKKLGVRIAVDDAGAGYASFRHILCLKPDIIKLDTSLVHDIDRNKDKQDLVAALREFCRRRGSALVAEGVETEGELLELIKLGVSHAQGYLLSKPCIASDLVDRTFGQYTYEPQSEIEFESLNRNVN